jgi:hypothetical protein
MSDCEQRSLEEVPESDSQIKRCFTHLNVGENDGSRVVAFPLFFFSDLPLFFSSDLPLFFSSDLPLFFFSSDLPLFFFSSDLPLFFFFDLPLFIVGDKVVDGDKEVVGDELGSAETVGDILVVGFEVGSADFPLLGLVFPALPVNSSSDFPALPVDSSSDFPAFPMVGSLVGVIVVVGEELTVGERVGNAPLPLLV